MKEINHLKSSRVFVSGTDTGVGKTLFSAILVKSLQLSHYNPFYFKPIQTGDDDDVQTVMRLGGVSESQVQHPIYQFDFPTAPARAAIMENREIDLMTIVEKDLSSRHEGVAVLEGAGGLFVPLSLQKKQTIKDLVMLLQVPLILVCSTRLGTINHILLSLEACFQTQIPVLGVVLNGPCDPGLKELIQDWSGIPCIAEVPFYKDVNPEKIEAFAKTWILSPEYLKLVNQFFTSTGNFKSHTKN